LPVQAHYQINVRVLNMRRAHRRGVYAVTQNDIAAADWNTAQSLATAYIRQLEKVALEVR
jgi:hypothetical protein